MVKLTQTVKKGGCAAKVPALVLREILSGVIFPPKIPGVIVDGEHFDDAAIFQIDDKISLVQTLDFFTPILDDPRDFGAVAAANALSDVYAMGGRPKTCMAILAAPLASMESTIIQDVLQGASDVIAEAGASLVGGHSIDDDTLKFGLSVTGLVDNDAVWTNEKAQAGDVIILTKAIGTGTICAGLKRQELDYRDAQDAIASMKKLNNIIQYLGPTEIKSIHGATDVTGFGLAGHGYQLARASGVTLKIQGSRLPLFTETLRCLSMGFLTKAHKSNDEYTKNKISFKNSDPQTSMVFFDPQTSGGLLLCVDPGQAQNIIETLSPHFPAITIIGEVLPKQEYDVIVE